jgi:hypothetical protein
VPGPPALVFSFFDETEPVRQRLRPKAPLLCAWALVLSFSRWNRVCAPEPAASVFPFPVEIKPVRRGLRLLYFLLPLKIRAVSLPQRSLWSWCSRWNRARAPKPAAPVFSFAVESKARKPAAPVFPSPVENSDHASEPFISVVSVYFTCFANFIVFFLFPWFFHILWIC